MSESWSPHGRDLLFSSRGSDILAPCTFDRRWQGFDWAWTNYNPRGVLSLGPLDRAQLRHDTGHELAESRLPPAVPGDARDLAPKVRIDYQPACTPDGQELIYVASITTGLMAAVTRDIAGGSDVAVLLRFRPS